MPMTSSMSRLREFYNIYHRDSKVQYSIIKSDNFTYRGAIKIIDKLIKNNKSLKILDYGCGVGTLSLYLADKGHFLTGVDISSNAINSAKKNSRAIGLEKNSKFYTLNEWNNLKKSNYYDLIISLEVIEHVENDRYLLKSFNDYLKHNGYLLLSTPTTNAPLYRLGLLQKFDKDVGHLRRYEISNLLAMITDCGFKIISSTKTEGIIRNSFFVSTKLGIFIKFFKGPISNIVSWLDNLTIHLFKESNIHVLASKK